MACDRLTLGPANAIISTPAQAGTLLRHGAATCGRHGAARMLAWRNADHIACVGPNYIGHNYLAQAHGTARLFWIFAPTRIGICKSGPVFAKLLLIFFSLSRRLAAVRTGAAQRLETFHDPAQSPKAGYNSVYAGSSAVYSLNAFGMRFFSFCGTLVPLVAWNPKK